MRLALNELKPAACHSISNTTCDHAPQVGYNHRFYMQNNQCYRQFYMQNNQWKSIWEYRGPTPTKSPIELRTTLLGTGNINISLEVGKTVYSQ